MRNPLLASALLPAIIAATPCPIHAQATVTGAQCPDVATTGPDVEAVRQLELRGGQVNVEGWTIEEARQFFAPEFVSIEPGGGVNRLDRVLSTFPDGRNAGFARSFDISGLEIHIYGCDIAMVTGTADVRVRAASPEAPPWRIRFLNMWRRDAGHWRLAANQFTRVTAASNNPASSEPWR